MDIGALNNLGQVAGYEYDPGAPEESHAFLWTPSVPNGTTGTTLELPPLPGDTGAQPAYIKDTPSLDSTTIVGRSFIVEAMPRAVVWYVGCDTLGNSVVRVFDLNDLVPTGPGWELQNTKAINQRGQIAGDGTTSGGSLTRAFLLTPANDCNGNGIPDECDIAGATSQDCNANEIPDECDACTVALCADTDCDGIRDDNCVWVECGGQGCSQTAVGFADVGGAFGDCQPDGFCNIHDRNHVMACFSGLSTCGCPGACSPP